MLERQMEDLIATYPKEFFPRKDLVLKGRQGSFSGVGRFDLLFEDENHTNVLIELKAVTAKYEHADQLGKYQTALEAKGERNVLMWLVAPVIPKAVRDFMDRIGIEYTEIHEAEYQAVAKRHGVTLDREAEEEADLTQKAQMPVTVDRGRLNQSAPKSRAAAPLQSSRAPGPQTQLAIIDAILGAYPYQDRQWLTAEHQVELLQRAYDAKLPDGRNAFPAMHGGADRGDAPRHWDGMDRTNRMRYHHVKQKNACQAQGRNCYILAEGVTPATIGVSQELVDKLAAYSVIPRYNVSATSHVAPEV